MSIDLRAVAPEECIACRAIREVVEHHGSGTCTAAVNGAEFAYFLGLLHGTACLATKTELRLCRAHAGELLRLREAHNAGVGAVGVREDCGAPNVTGRLRCERLKGHAGWHRANEGLYEHQWKPEG